MKKNRIGVLSKQKAEGATLPKNGRMTMYGKSQNEHRRDRLEQHI